MKFLVWLERDDDNDGEGGSSSYAVSLSSGGGGGGGSDGLSDWEHEFMQPDEDELQDQVRLLFSCLLFVLLISKWNLFCSLFEVATKMVWYFSSIVESRCSRRRPMAKCRFRSSCSAPSRRCRWRSSTRTPTALAFVSSARSRRRTPTISRTSTYIVRWIDRRLRWFSRWKHWPVSLSFFFLLFF